ncbi:MAG: lysylphosphatidylglycerol synthase transmembrane domain-containing protein [Salinisphaera sp.]|jgi:uncharacterized membrane protein YbhN (UPF0104 family)|nr:lysylphosphatidylglycerol synthase transmembrane domain-containing protein [Salinisphaera sp.]
MAAKKTPTDSEHRSPSHGLRRSVAVLPGLALALALVAWLLHGLNIVRVIALIGHADLLFLGLLVASIVAEYGLRAWKWGQVMVPLGRFSTGQLFAAYMAGFVPGLTVGLGSSVLTRAWLVARRARLSTGVVLGSVAVDRLIDAFVFVGFIALATFAVPARGTPALALALRWGGVVVLAVAGIALLLLIRQRRRPLSAPWLPCFARAYWEGLTASFAEGIAWPIHTPRRAAIVGASVLVRLVSASQIAWAGGAIGVWLAPLDYILILVLLGTWIIVSLFVRVPGSGLLIVAFVLQLFGLTREQALAITLLDTGVFFAVVGLIGGIVLWREGVRISELRRLRDPA